MKTAVTLFISVLVVIIISLPAAAQNAEIYHSFQFDHLPLRAALDSLMKWYPQSIVYLDNDIEGKFASDSCLSAGFEQALSTVLNGTSLMWIRSGNQVILKRENLQQPKEYATISGTLTDSVTGEWIAGASVLLQNSNSMANKTIRRWCPTNAFGFFSLPRIPLGRYNLIVRALGYKAVKQNMNITADGSIQSDIRLVQKEIVLKEVTIEGSRTALSSANGLSHGIYLPSVPTDQNQYMLDGGRIYNPSHFGGVLSTFNNAALNDVQVVIGGIPPDYGGRVGGILDLSMRDGTRHGLSGSLGIGSIGSNFCLEGPMSGNSTFLISGRRGYPNAAMQFLYPGEFPDRAGSFELIAKLAHRLSGNEQISLTGYFGRDSYSNEVKEVGGQLDNNFSWGNGMLNLRWIGIVSPSLFLYSSLVYSRYGFDLGHALIENSSPYSGIPLSSNYTIEDVSLRAHAEDYYDEEHTVRAGVELVHHTISVHISQFSSQTALFILQDFSSWEASVYLQDQWKILPRIMAEIGGRATSYAGDKGSFSSVDPRFSLLVSVDEQTRLYSSLSAINQFIHPYRNSGVFLLYPAIFWYPSTEKIRPTISLDGTFGVEREISDDAYFASAETFYRITNNFHEFVLDTTAAAAQDLSNTIIFGSAKTYGLMCLLQKRTGNLTGSISYNLSWSFEAFAEINGGKEFSPPFDRRHEIQLTCQYAAGGNWMFSMLCVLALGHSSSLAPIVIQSKNSTKPQSLDGIPFITAARANDELLDINGSRLPGFQRLELNIVRRFSLRGFPCQLSFRLINSYGLLDPFTWKLQKSNYIALRWNAALRETGLFPLYPAIELTMRF